MADEQPAVSLIIVWALIGACVLVAILGLIVVLTCWLKLRQDAKTYNETGYHAYASDVSVYSQSGDHKLAQSAQLYHYQRQKQKILELERAESDNDIDDKTMWDDDEVEEVAVYECPGLAPMAGLEVRNPYFDESRIIIN